MQFWLLDLEINGTCDGMNFIHLTFINVATLFCENKTLKM